MTEFPTLSARDLQKSYGARDVVRGVTIEMKGGEIVGLLGPIKINKQEITSLPPYKRASSGVVYLPQESSVFRKLTVEENIRAIVQTLGVTKNEQKNLVDLRLNDLGLEKLAKQKADNLSGGERRRLEISRALVLSPKFLLLDEPFSGVDPISVEDLVRIMFNLKNRGMGILITDHSVRETLRAVDRAYLLFDGSVLKHGNAEFLISDPETRQKYLGKDFEC